MTFPLARKFVRAQFGAECLIEGETQADLDEAQDDFFTGIINAQYAAHYDEIDCAACGSPDIERRILVWPQHARTVTTQAGHLYGYVTCAACNALAEADPDTFVARVDANLDAALDLRKGKR